MPCWHDWAPLSTRDAERPELRSRLVTVRLADKRLVLARKQLPSGQSSILPSYWESFGPIDSLGVTFTGSVLPSQDNFAIAVYNATGEATPALSAVLALGIGSPTSIPEPMSVGLILQSATRTSPHSRSTDTGELRRPVRHVPDY